MLNKKDYIASKLTTTAWFNCKGQESYRMWYLATLFYLYL